MLESIAPPILPLLLLLACAAFFSASETSLFSLSRFQLRQMRERHHITFAKIRYLLDRPAALVATTLLGNELASVLISHIMANYFNQHFSSPLLASIVNLCLVVPILVIFGEITPKILAAKTNQSTAIIVTPIVWLFFRISLPIRFCLEKFVELLTVKIRKNSPDEHQLKEEDFLDLLEEGKLKGAIHESEQELIENVFGIDDDKVLELSTPLYELFTVKQNADITEVIKELKNKFIPRIPVMSENGQKVVGVLYAKDLLKYTHREGHELEVSSFMKPPLVIDGNMKVEALFKRFRQLKVHIAFIESKQNRALAAITMEDILEQMFGELWEEEND